MPTLGSYPSASQEAAKKNPRFWASAAEPRTPNEAMEETAWLFREILKAAGCLRSDQVLVDGTTGVNK